MNKKTLELLYSKDTRGALYNKPMVVTDVLKHYDKAHQMLEHDNFIESMNKARKHGTIIPIDNSWFND